MHQLIKSGYRTLTPLLALAALAGTGSVHAQNLLQNGSFESGAFVNNGAGAMSLTPGATTITGWTVTNAELAWLVNGNAYNLNASDGSYFLDLTGYHDSAPYGGVTQSFATVAGSTYHLAFDLGTNQSDGRYAGPISVSALVGGGTSQTFLADYAPTGTGNQSQTFGYDFVASSPFTSLTLTGTRGNQHIGLDNVSVTTNGVPPVPEASTSVSLGLLMALGAGGVFAARQRKSVC